MLWTRITVLKLFFFLALPGLICGSISAVLFAVAVTHGHPTTFSEPHIGYQSGPSTRGTFIIISSCLFTIFSCIYVAMHPDIPRHTYRPNDDHNGDDIRSSKIVLALVTLLAPEVVFVLLVLSQATKAWKNTGKVHSKGYRQWSTKMSFVLQQKGFTRGPDPRNDEKLKDVASLLALLEPKSDEQQLEIDYDFLSREIGDRSKSSAFSKLVVVLQILNLAAQVIGRLASKLPVTPLECVTCGYVLWAIAIYVVWWEKPYEMKERVWLKLVERTESKESESEGKKAKRRRSLAQIYYQWDPFNGMKTDIVVYLFTSLLGVPFGLIHVAAWDKQFVSSWGQPLWRYSAVGQTVAAVFIPVTFFFFWIVSRDRLQLRSERIRFFLGYSPLPFIIIARFNLLFMAIWSFWSLPEGAYVQLDWTIFIPSYLTL
ncbi:hypothetical protein BXZ70DRAFT_904573 [Cristinia sonorae]|uniref:Uncharacterized protein n=1 Tax=Cristinia sonorae TaxID=1940300 RepID=A0A8K0UWS6_9AGAR|nr:hypothetical protein BXZ70DRAFT_904573 [Cristinia sonorae]